MVRYEVPVVITKNGEMQFDLPADVKIENVKSLRLVFEVETLPTQHEESWGEQFVALLNSLDMSDWEAMDISNGNH